MTQAEMVRRNDEEQYPETDQVQAHHSPGKPAQAAPLGRGQGAPEASDPGHHASPIASGEGLDPTPAASGGPGARSCSGACQSSWLTDPPAMVTCAHAWPCVHSVYVPAVKPSNTAVNAGLPLMLRSSTCLWLRRWRSCSGLISISPPCNSGAGG